MNEWMNMSLTAVSSSLLKGVAWRLFRDFKQRIAGWSAGALPLGYQALLRNGVNLRFHIFITVAVNTEWTKPIKIDCGVLQGDPSSPLLFKIRSPTNFSLIFLILHVKSVKPFQNI